MRRMRSSPLSLSALSTFILFLLLTFSVSTPGAFAQESRQKMRPTSATDGDKDKDNDQPQKRALWNMRGRESLKGQPAAALRLRAHQQKMAMRAARLKALAKTGAAPNGNSPSTSWTPLGPAPLASDATGNGFQDYNWVSGRATSVLIDPADATGNTVLLGGAYGGLWKSTNAGSKSVDSSLVTWQSLIDGQPSLAVGAIALQPGNSNLILVGTGETNASGDSYYGIGMLRSTDGGTTWSTITTATTGQSFVGIGFSKIAFSTSNTNLVVATTAGDIGYDYGLEQNGNSTARGIYYSTDAGATWTRVTLADGAVPASVTGLVYNGTSGTFFAAIRRHGIYSSTDGQHFSRLATQPTSGLTSANCPANSNSTNCQIYRAEFAVTPGRNETYVWIMDSTQSGEVDDGIWRTTNAGSAWTQIPDNGITNCGSGGGGSEGGCGVDQGEYDLELAALPNSTGTDLYAGTINLYKCTIASGASACSTIDPNVPNDWINLTHVYGCPVLGELAHVHPDQHALGFLGVSGGTAPGYFAHDGGISRTLDSYTGLNSGSCTGTNQFDSLSQTLGSMTEFVSFSVHPTNPDIMLGGTQDNGSPTTQTATSSATWQNALGGDGGYNAINPNSVNEWFASNPGSVIGICESGTSCNDNTFFLEAQPGYPSNGNIDQGAFYTPFILDPQSTGVMLIGTCRIWRGPVPLNETPGVFAQISNNFDTGTTTLCNGGEINQVASLAAGGPTDTNGYSNVVYATTWGYGPYAGVGGGEVWVTTNAATTVPTNVTGSINPNHYAIHSVAIDTSIASGQTAYVGIMGFQTSHIFKTTNAGSSWADWTGTGSTALPDAPISSLLVDSSLSPSLIYAGTDVGVFVSSSSSASWTEVGPAAGSGSGYLPSAPVTALQMFNSGGIKELRVSTYGRGIWQFVLAGLSSTTTALTTSPNPAIQGASVTLTATVATTGPNPPTGTVTFYNGSTAIGSPATLNGSQVATLSTTTLPVGTDSITAVYNGDTNNASSTSTPVSQVITAVTTTTTLTSNHNPANYGAAVTFTATVVTSGTQPVTGSVTFYSGSTALGSAVTLNGSGVATLTISTLAVGTDSITAVYSGDVNNSGSTSTPPLSEVINAPVFTVTNTGSLTSTVLSGQSTAVYAFTVAPVAPATNFGAAVTLACSFTPTDPTLTASSCVFSGTGIANNTIPAGSGSTAVTLTVTTTGPNQSLSGPQRQHRADNRTPWLPLALPLAGVVVVGLAGRRISKRSAIAGLCVSLILLGLMLACGGSSSRPIAVTVAGPSTGVYPNDAADSWPVQTAQFTATVSNTTNTAVTWAVTTPNGGTIDATGLYTAPTIAAGLPSSVTITATSQADTSKVGTTTLTLKPATVPGTYTINVTATDPAALPTTQTLPLTLVVQ
jgi:hypothetical protein